MSLLGSQYYKVVPYIWTSYKLPLVKILLVDSIPNIFHAALYVDSSSLSVYIVCHSRGHDAGLDTDFEETFGTLGITTDDELKLDLCFGTNI